MNTTFSKEELGVIRTVFDSCDAERLGKIHINQFSILLSKLGKNEDEILGMTDAASRIADDNEGCLHFNEIVGILQQYDRNNEEMPFEGSDPKVLEFLRILEDYRLKCEEEGNYLEAGRAFRQLGVLRKQEEKRQQKAVQARQISEKQDVQLAHNMQFSEFNKSWDKYMEEYDSMAQMYIQQMTERHAFVLLEFQKQLRQELASKPPKWSRELMDQRRKQHINARNKNYVEAQKLKKESDRHEERERREMEQSQAIVFTRREAKFRMQQQTELQALLKRIECRRKEHLKQRGQDTKRLLQRNRNVQAVLETKQATESQKLFAEIKKNLYSSAVLNSTAPGSQSVRNPAGMNGNPGGMSGNTSKKSSASAAKLLHRFDSNTYTGSTEAFNNSNGYGHHANSDSQGQYYSGHGTPGGMANDYQQYGGGENDDEEHGGYQGNDGSDPQFMKDNGPNFTSLVYNGGEGSNYDDNSYEEGGNDYIQ